MTLVKGRRNRPDSVDVEKTQSQSQDQDVGKSFIRSVRRISIVGRHKRQKSGTTVPLAVGRSSLGSQPESVALPVQEPQALLPPVEIQAFPGPQDQSSTPSEPHISSSSPPPTEAEVIYQPEEAESHIIKPSLPQTPRKSGDPRTPATSPKRSLPRSPRSPGKGMTSRQSASWAGLRTRPPGRMTVPRRSRDGGIDLKIPARISQPQVGLRRDLGMVRDFAQNVERMSSSSFLFLATLTFVYVYVELKGLQGVYHGLVLGINNSRRIFIPSSRNIVLRGSALSC